MRDRGIRSRPFVTATSYLDRYNNRLPQATAVSAEIFGEPHAHRLFVLVPGKQFAQAAIDHPYTLRRDGHSVTCPKLHYDNAVQLERRFATRLSYPGSRREPLRDNPARWEPQHVQRLRLWHDLQGHPCRRADYALQL